MNLNQFLKKVGRGTSHDLFSNWYYLILHTLGYLKPVTVFECEVNWVNSYIDVMITTLFRQQQPLHCTVVLAAIYIQLNYNTDFCPITLIVK
jgi:hypothetical protein